MYRNNSFTILFLLCFFSCHVTKPKINSCNCNEIVNYGLFCSNKPEELENFISIVESTEGVKEISIDSVGVATLLLEQSFFNDKGHLSFDFNHLIFNDIYTSFFRFKKINGIQIYLDSIPFTMLPITGGYSLLPENNTFYKKYYYDCMNLAVHLLTIDSLISENNSYEIPNKYLENWGRKKDHTTID